MKKEVSLMDNIDRIIKNMRLYISDSETALQKLSYEIDRLRDELGRE